MTQKTLSLTGPTIPARGNGKEKLVILLHGYGSNGDNLIDLGATWCAHMPNVTFMAPHGFDPWEESPVRDAYQWFSFQDWTQETILKGLTNVAPRINAFLDDILALKNLTDQDLILVGFSQGAMVSLFTALRRRRAIAGVLAYSGCLVWPHGQKPLSLPPVSLIHGKDDTVVPYALMENSRAQLASLGAQVSALSLDNMAHSIDGRATDAGLNFIQTCFEKIKN